MADDGVLIEGEILAWQFLVVGSRSNISGSSDATLGSAVEALNISIDADFITVDDSIDGRNRRLSLIAFSGNDGDDGTLTWLRGAGLNGYSVAVTQHCMPPHDPRVSPCFRDLHIPLWASSPVSLGGDPWVVAAARESSSLGDCNADGTVDATDFACVVDFEQRDVVLNVLNTLPGDLDGNGEVDFADFLVLSVNYGQDFPSYRDGNIDLKGHVDFADFLVLSANFGKTPGDVAAVPEPHSWVVGFGFLSLVVFRRHRRR